MHNNIDRVPIVAIVGKPNVGKSSIFNRLIGKRKAIISEEPGVTRDINYETLRIDQCTLKLADSAGFSVVREEIHERTRALNEQLISQSSVVILTCEVNSLDSEDFAVAETIRKSGKPSILVINKVDNEELMDGFYEFFELGFQNPIPVSASHGTNFGILKQHISDILKNEMLVLDEYSLEEARKHVSFDEELSSGTDNILWTESRPDRGGIHVAIVGKPNVGKSSLLNLLVNSERSLVTPNPGTTRDAVDETICHRNTVLTFVDTAGIRRRSKIRKNVEFYSILRAEKAIKSARITVLVIDAEQGITHQEKRIADLIVNEKKGLIIAINKWDLIKGVNEADFKRDFFNFFPHISFAEFLTVSAATGYNKEKLLNLILKVNNNYTQRIKTSSLNAIARNLSLQNIRITYGIQKSTAPPMFEFFIRGAGKNVENFRRFVINSIRKNFSFGGVPIEVHLRKE
jgi:GTP-binding protein